MLWSSHNISTLIWSYYLITTLLIMIFWYYFSSIYDDLPNAHSWAKIDVRPSILIASWIKYKCRKTIVTLSIYVSSKRARWTIFQLTTNSFRTTTAVLKVERDMKQCNSNNPQGPIHSLVLNSRPGKASKGFQWQQHFLRFLEH